MRPLEKDGQLMKTDAAYRTHPCARAGYMSHPCVRFTWRSRNLKSSFIHYLFRIKVKTRPNTLKQESAAISVSLYYEKTAVMLCHYLDCHFKILARQLIKVHSNTFKLQRTNTTVFPRRNTSVHSVLSLVQFT